MPSTVTRVDDLNERMSIDHVIRVHADGTVTDAPEHIWGPELNDAELSCYYQCPGWSFFSTGYSGQYGYSGPVMHDSEYIGGRLERDILAQPGYYVALACDWDTTDDERCVEGWAVAYLATDGN